VPANRPFANTTQSITTSHLRPPGPPPATNQRFCGMFKDSNTAQCRTRKVFFHNGRISPCARPSSFYNTRDNGRSVGIAVKGVVQS